MKRFMPVVIATVACAVLAGEKVLAAEQPQPSKTETYSYGTKLDIAKVVSSWTNIPVSRMLESERRKSTAPPQS